MPKMTEAEALALLIHNAKSRSRKTDLLTLAEASEYLEQLYESKEEVARRVDVNPETLRVYGLVRRLPEEVKRLVRSRLIDNPEVVEAILRLPDEQKRLELANAVVSYGLNTQDTRNIEKYCRYNPEATVEESISRVLRSKPTVEKRYVLITELAEGASVGLSRVRDEDRLEFFSKALGTRVISYDLRGGSLLLLLSEEAFATLSTKARKAKTPLEVLIDNEISQGLGAGS
jgi:hypothetical protein